jgi:hypothetical protein
LRLARVRLGGALRGALGPVLLRRTRGAVWPFQAWLALSALRSLCAELALDARRVIDLAVIAGCRALARLFRSLC